jgi:hypothetical protein
LENRNPEASDAAIIVLAAGAQELPLPPLPGLPVPIEHSTAETVSRDRKPRALKASFAIYSAASLTVAASAPGLTSMFQRDKERDKRRSSAVGRGRK